MTYTDMAVADTISNCIDQDSYEEMFTYVRERIGFRIDEFMAELAGQEQGEAEFYCKPIGAAKNKGKKQRQVAEINIDEWWRIATE